MCVHPNKSGSEVMESLCLSEAERVKDVALYKEIFNLLSYEKISFSGRFCFPGDVFSLSYEKMNFSRK